MLARSILSLTLPIFFSFPFPSLAYTWTFDSPPRQCANLSISISGNGQPPYSVLILPFGPSPLPNNIEARRILDQPFPSSTATQVSFQLNYPTNSQLVAVVSDQSGFGSGGTSVAAQVLTSNDASCFDASTNVSPQFVFSIDPPNQIVQCSPTRIWWDNSTVQGNPTFLGIIPGGQSFTVPTSPTSNVPSQGTGFTWTPSVRAGTTLFLVGGDNRGKGSAGSILNTVSAGTTSNSGCLNDQSPSSTPAKPAGGSYPTSASDSGNYGNGTANGQNHNSNNTGAIIGGVIGGLVFLAALALVLFFLHRSRRLANQRQSEKPVDLLNTDDDDEADEAATSTNRRASRNELPQYYQPEPFMVPDPTLRSSFSTEANTNPGARPLSGATSTSRSDTPDLLGAVAGVATSTTSGVKKGVMRGLRAVNIIQHDDAGPSGPPEEAREDETETIELPPAYTNIRK